MGQAKIYIACTMYQALFQAVTIHYLIAYHYYPNSTNEETKAERGEVTRPRSHICPVVGLWSKIGSRVHVQSHNITLLFTGLRGPESKMMFCHTHQMILGKLLKPFQPVLSSSKVNKSKYLLWWRLHDLSPVWAQKSWYTLTLNTYWLI